MTVPVALISMFILGALFMLSINGIIILCISDYYDEADVIEIESEVEK